jgi:hypothetical protein
MKTYTVTIKHLASGRENNTDFYSWGTAYQFYGLMLAANGMQFDPNSYWATEKNLWSQDDFREITLTINHPKTKLTDEQQDVVMQSLRAKFDDRLTTADNCLLICETAVALGLPDDFCREMFSDLLDTWPQMKEYVQSIYN